MGFIIVRVEESIGGVTRNMPAEPRAEHKSSYVVIEGDDVVRRLMQTAGDAEKRKPLNRHSRWQRDLIAILDLEVVPDAARPIAFDGELFEPFVL